MDCLGLDFPERPRGEVEVVDSAVIDALAAKAMSEEGASTAPYSYPDLESFLMQHMPTLIGTPGAFCASVATQVHSNTFLMKVWAPGFLE